MDNTHNDNEYKLYHSNKINSNQYENKRYIFNQIRIFMIQVMTNQNEMIARSIAVVLRTDGASLRASAHICKDKSRLNSSCFFFEHSQKRFLTSEASSSVISALCRNGYIS